MKKTQQIIALIFLLFTMSACATNKVVEKPLEIETKTETNMTKKGQTLIKNCVCIQMWLPVCGSDGKTYSNSCVAKCAGVSFTQGACNSEITK